MRAERQNREESEQMRGRDDVRGRKADQSLSMSRSKAEQKQSKDDVRGIARAEQKQEQG